MFINKHFFSPIILSLLLLPFAWTAVQAALPASVPLPTNVELIEFSVSSTPGSNGVFLEWQTGSELGTAGFVIHRRTGSSGAFVYLENIGFIDAEGGPGIGNHYSAMDETAVLGQTYTYRLYEIEFNGNMVALEDATITVGAPPTATPTRTPTASPTATATATVPATATATATPSPTSTPQPGGSGNATATATATVAATATNATQSGNTSTPRANPTATAVRTNPTATPTATQRAASPPSGAPPTGSTGSGTGAGTGGSSGTGQSASQPTAPDRTQPTATPTATTTAGDGSTTALALTGPTTTGDEQPPDSDISFNSDGTQFVITPGDSETPGPRPSIGSESRPAGESAQVDQGQTQSRTSPGSLLLLWGGFILALLIFIVSVVGSIYLFTRRQE